MISTPSHRLPLPNTLHLKCLRGNPTSHDISHFFRALDPNSKIDFILSSIPNRTKISLSFKVQFSDTALCRQLENDEFLTIGSSTFSITPATITTSILIDPARLFPSKTQVDLEGVMSMVRMALGPAFHHPFSLVQMRSSFRLLFLTRDAAETAHHILSNHPLFSPAPGRSSCIRWPNDRDNNASSLFLFFDSPTEWNSPTKQTQHSPLGQTRQKRAVRPNDLELQVMVSEFKTNLRRILESELEAIWEKRKQAGSAFTTSGTPQLVLSLNCETDFAKPNGHCLIRGVELEVQEELAFFLFISFIEPEHRNKLLSASPILQTILSPPPPSTLPTKPFLFVPITDTTVPVRVLINGFSNDSIIFGPSPPYARGEPSSLAAPPITSTFTPFSPPLWGTQQTKQKRFGSDQIVDRRPLNDTPPPLQVIPALDRPFIQSPSSIILTPPPFPSPSHTQTDRSSPTLSFSPHTPINTFLPHTYTPTFFSPILPDTSLTFSSSVDARDGVISTPSFHAFSQHSVFGHPFPPPFVPQAERAHLLLPTPPTATVSPPTITLPRRTHQNRNSGLSGLRYIPPNLPSPHFHPLLPPQPADPAPVEEDALRDTPPHLPSDLKTSAHITHHSFVPQHITTTPSVSEAVSSVPITTLSNHPSPIVSPTSETPSLFAGDDVHVLPSPPLSLRRVASAVDGFAGSRSPLLTPVHSPNPSFSSLLSDNLRGDDDPDSFEKWDSHQFYNSDEDSDNLTEPDDLY
ncbi:hypothetical protein BLNAU_1393 [Blattamonas nauphoetae]|uniref:Uncharacterized protein n=1 Tax=Blattamonas nauphoetae TaxID=2049346 RepID=A0ABQ9YJ82_9EUKA|nr:hypothetical protein BLNAU_1393 [Blattamonas nauphoetae]